MKAILRILVFSLIASFGISGVFADNNTGSTASQKSAVQKDVLKKDTTKKEVNTVSSDDTTDEDSGETIQARKEKIKEEVTSYIIDSYKAQGDKIIKDLDQTLQKTIPEKGARVEAYKKIETTLESRRSSNKNSLKITETSKKIIDAFLTHMIDSIGKKVNELTN